MPFESLSYRHVIPLPSVPHRWLPLLHFYDADLPLFPIYYFHVLRPGMGTGSRPRFRDRAYGYVEHIRVRDDQGIDVHIVSNKDLSSQLDAVFFPAVEAEITERFGIGDPVRQADVRTAFLPPLDGANPVLDALWRRVVADAYGDLLPFGRLWDHTLGLARFVASWNPPGGRKSELIQTHYFVSRFGERILSAAGIPQNDFYLLPTIGEVVDPEDSLSDFPRFRSLCDVADRIARNHGAVTDLGSMQITRFRNPNRGRFDTAALTQIINSANIPQAMRPAALECFNSFDKGPQRTIIYLLMLHDLRNGLLQPATLTAQQCGSIYESLGGSYQSPKVIEIYAQQCFGNSQAMPIDTWIETFLKWPLNVFPQRGVLNPFLYLFSHATNLGKVERLLWVTGQARKVHSSACNDAAWCAKYGSDNGPRGANPLSCNICTDSIRRVCPAFQAIKDKQVGFNGASPEADFQITTDQNNNTTPNQTFSSCRGQGTYGPIEDTFSPADEPLGFAPFPARGHDGAPMTVEDFVGRY